MRTKRVVSKKIIIGSVIPEEESKEKRHRKRKYVKSGKYSKRRKVAIVKTPVSYKVVRGEEVCIICKTSTDEHGDVTLMDVMLSVPLCSDCRAAARRLSSMKRV